MTDEVLQELVAASHGWIGDAPNGAMLKATRAFLARAREDATLLEQAAASLDTMDPGAAAWIAVAAGTVVEDGSPAELTGPAVFGLLRSWLAKFPALQEGAEAELTAGQRTLLPPFRYLCQSVVTHLARLPAQREVLAQDTPLIERLSEVGAFSHGAIWVREALLKSSGTLLLLHPVAGVGVRIRYTNVSNNFHLFSLMQSALGAEFPGGKPVNAAMARAARGRSTESGEDEAWWHYGNASSPTPEITASIWGEALVSEIPRIDGVPVILAWPSILRRTWDAAFLGPHLDAMPADAGIESRLTTEEVQAWLQRLGISGAKPWWRFW